MTRPSQVGEKPNALGDRLREARQRARRSIDAAAAALQINRNTLGAYERGKRLPDIDFLVEFARGFDTPLTELLQLRLSAAGVRGVTVDERPFRVLREDQADYAAGFDERLLHETIAAVEETAAELSLSFEVDAKARVIIEIYKAQAAERARGGTGLSGAEIVRLIRRAK